MRRRPFGSTGWEISVLGLGMIELGVDAPGLDEPDDSGRPSRDQTLALLHRAFDQGVNLVDAAASHGVDESLVGAALVNRAERIYVATRISAETPGGANPRDTVTESIARSLEGLGRHRLDLVQIQCASADDLDGPVMEALISERESGRIEHLGALVHDPVDALKAIRNDEIEVVQVAFNLLDQRAAEEVFPAAERGGVALLVRSVLLEGVLTERRRGLPEEHGALHRAADRAERWARRNRLDLTTAALRFCLSQPEVGAALVGARTSAALDDAIAAADAPDLPRHKLSDAGPVAVDDEDLVDPRRWGAA